MEIDS